MISSKLISDRVTHFSNTPTYGMIDYTSVHRVSIESRNQNIFFGYPTSKLAESWKLPGYEDGYNKSGLSPNVFINSNIEDEITFILNYYRK